MTAKEYLSLIRQLDIKIGQKLSELDELHDIASAVGSFDYSRDRVQTSPKGEAPYAGTAEKAVAVADEVRELERQYSEMCRKMDMMCESALTEEELLIVRMRYYHNWKWSDIIGLMEIDERAVYRKHAQALDKLESQDIVV